MFCGQGKSENSLGKVREFHDDVIKCKHFPRYWSFVREFTGHRWFGELRRHRAHADVVEISRRLVAGNPGMLSVKCNEVFVAASHSDDVTASTPVAHDTLKRCMHLMNAFFSYTIFSCNQAALQMVFSVRPSVCLSVRLSVTPFSPCSHHRIIMKFSGVITMVKSDVHAKGQGQRSRSQRSTPNLAVSGL